MIKTYNIDCIDFMKKIPDKYYDLSICDPPYGRNNLNKNKKTKFKNLKTTYKNSCIPSDEYFYEIDRISKNYIIWGCHYMPHCIKENGTFIVWNKCANPDIHHMSACDIAFYSKKDRIKMYTAAWCGAVKCKNIETIHPHEKPVSLYKWLLLNYAKKEYKIFDSHGGSGSILIACFELDFNIDWCEIDKIYYNNALNRLNLYKKQKKLDIE